MDMSALVISSYLQWEQKSKQHPSYFYSLRFSSPVALCQCTFIPAMVSMLSRCFMTIWITTMILHLHRGGEALWWARLPVCLCVREHIFRATHMIFTNFFVHVAYGHGWVLLRRGWRNRKGKGQFWGFPPHWQCTVMRSLKKGSAGKGVMGVHSADEVWSTIALLENVRKL